MVKRICSITDKLQKNNVVRYCNSSIPDDVARRQQVVDLYKIHRGALNFQDYSCHGHHHQKFGDSLALQKD